MKKPLNPLYTYTLILLAMLFWGLTFVWSSIVLNYYSPVTTIFLRLLISTILMFIGLKIFGMIEKIRKADIPLFLSSAILNPFLYFLGENYGIKYSSPTISAVAIAMIPVFMPIFSYFFLKEKLNLLNTIGMIISFGGILLMLLKPDFSLNARPEGVFALSVAIIAAIGYSILLKKLADSYSPFFIIATQNLIGILLFLPLFLWFDWQQFISTPITFQLASSLLQLAIFGSSLAFVFFTIGMREIGVNKTNFFTNLIPIITAIFSYFVIGEMFTERKLLGMVIVLGGVILTQWQHKNRNRLMPSYRFFWRSRK
jgi:drug/metabolite transporter (DMT)-like permease